MIWLSIIAFGIICFVSGYLACLLNNLRSEDNEEITEPSVDDVRALVVDVGYRRRDGVQRYKAPIDRRAHRMSMPEMAKKQTRHCLTAL